MTAAPRFLGPEFNRFLFAMVGTDRHGGQLTVLSALARLDLDAWAEAATLARLPRDTAISKLSAILRRLPEFPQLVQETGGGVARLIALLPGSALPKHVAKVLPVRWTAGRATGFGIMILLWAMIGLQLLGQAPNRHAPASAPANEPVTLAPHADLNSQ